MGAKKKSGNRDLIDSDNWKEVTDFAKSAGVTAKELYNYTIKKFRIKTDIMTMAIGCLVYDTLKKKSKLSTRSRIPMMATTTRSSIRVKAFLFIKKPAT